MSKAKAISDEQIIAALLTHRTIKEAAAAAGISERAIYDRMNAGSFQALYKAAKSDLMRSAAIDLQAHINAAIDTIAEIMTNKDNNAAIRLQAAQTILNNAAKFTQRLTEQEAAAIMQAEANRYTEIFNRIDNAER